LVLDRSAVINGCRKRSIAWHITGQKDLENVWIFMRNRTRVKTSVGQLLTFKEKKSASSSFLKLHNSSGSMQKWNLESSSR
jgi:hypothetical protein